jgi:predicted acetyltransferase
MSAIVRRLAAGEERAFVRSAMVPFLVPVTGDPDNTDEIDQWAARIEAARAWVVEDRGRVVGNAAIHSLDVTVPASPGQACPVIPMAGVTAVGVHPTHRRRGLLGQMMAAMLEDARTRGEAIACLDASESSIYGRFGFGHATDVTELRIDSRAAAFIAPPPDTDVHLAERDEAVKVLPDLFDQQRRSRAGEVNRDSQRWESILTDRARDRGAGLGSFYALAEQGYARYRAHHADIARAERARVVVEELRGLTPDVEAALWRFVLDIDLVGEVAFKRRPVDEPLRWRLRDARQLRTVSVDDELYVRVLDVPAAFGARGYHSSGRLVFEVLPPEVDEGTADAAPGRWVLECGPEGASCRAARPGENADLRLGLTALGTLYLGGFRASQLAAARLVEEVTAGGLDRADALLVTAPAPASTTGF